jgi:hypothetical protein
MTLWMLVAPLTTALAAGNGTKMMLGEHWRSTAGARGLQVLDFGAADYAASTQAGYSAAPAPGVPIDFSAHEGALWANGKKFYVKGINWYGSEGRTGAPTGLHKHSIDWYIDLLAENGFNALRLLFNHESALHDGPIETVDVRFSPQLFGMTYLEMFAEIADRAAQKGLLVMIACHRLNPTAWPGGGKWYVDSAPDSAILSAALDAILDQRDPVGRMIAADCLG